MNDRPTETEMISHVLQPVAEGIQDAFERLNGAKDSAMSWQRYELASQLRNIEMMLQEWQQKLVGVGTRVSPLTSEQDDNGKAENRTE